MPEVMVRVGRKDIADIQYSFGFNFPASVPVLLHELSIGPGFGFRTGYGTRSGTAISDEY